MAIQAPPDPMVPAEVDLRDFPYMPLDVLRLRDSALATTVTGEEFRAAVMLWCAAWHQVPAASLPDDDALLAQYAGYGRVVREWRKVRDGALRGFVKCSDGRLYHPVVAEKALNTWEKTAETSRRRARERERKKAARAHDEAEMSAGQTGSVTATTAACPPDNGCVSAGQTPNVLRTDAHCPAENALNLTEPNRTELERERTETEPRSLRSPSAHAFTGKIIRLNQQDFDNWERIFHGYPDLRAELTTIDAKLISEGHTGQWLGKVSGWLRKGHETRLASREARQTPEDTDTVWRGHLRAFVKARDDPTGRWRGLGYWPETKGPPPGRAGCQAPRHLLAEFGLMIEAETADAR